MASAAAHSLTCEVVHVDLGASLTGDALYCNLVPWLETYPAGPKTCAFLLVSGLVARGHAPFKYKCERMPFL